MQIIPKGVYVCNLKDQTVYIRPDMGYRQCFAYSDIECTQLAKNNKGLQIIVTIRERFGMNIWPYSQETSPNI